MQQLFSVLCLGVLSNLASAETLEWQGRHALVAAESQGLLTSYHFRTTEKLRENYPASQAISVRERNDWPRVRTGSALFDGTFALALDELSQNAVEHISDPAFISAQCSCFVAGKKWPYVWTRDIAYSVYFGIGGLEPDRAVQSMLFKLSPYREGDHLQVAQDTGTGGSWPVSTDRVTWFLGAQRLIDQLPLETRASFASTFDQALKNTLAADRYAAFDPQTGLYYGEQSFLDWREQSNPPWTANNAVGIAEAAAMSTNALHFFALNTARELSQSGGQSPEAAHYEHQANALRTAIDEHFWDQDAGLYRTLTGPSLNPASVQRFDLLAQSLAVLTGLTSQLRGQKIFSSYPQTAAGAPAQWPQDPVAPIYHNRSVWPFVTAMAIKAAAQVKHPSFVDHNLRTLLRGAVLNLSHMENFEFLQLANWREDDRRSGPVVNSQRQLWSVAGFISVAQDVLFGQSECAAGLKFSPFIPAASYRELFHHSTEMRLIGLRSRNRTIDIVLDFNQTHIGSQSNEFYAADRIVIGDRTYTANACIPLEEIQIDRPIVIRMALNQAPGTTLRLVEIEDPTAPSGTDLRKIMSPATPELQVRPVTDGIELSFGNPAPTQVSARVYRNGQRLADGIREQLWRDQTVSPATVQCYSVSLVDDLSGNESFPSPTHCNWPSGSVFELRPDELSGIRVPKDGRYGFQFLHANPGPINTGITAAIRSVRIIDIESEAVAGQFVAVMPHTGGTDIWQESRMGFASLRAGGVYRMVIDEHFNMSDLAHFATYLNRGGMQGPDRSFLFAGVRVLNMVENSH